MDTVSKQNTIIIENCGTEFINGVYSRTERFQFSKQSIHPLTKKVVTMEIRKHTDSNSLSIPPSLYHKDDDELYVISCVTPSIHFYLCIVHYFGFVKSKHRCEWMAVAGLEPLPKLMPIDNIKTFFDFPFYEDARIISQSISNAVPADQKQLVKSSNIFSHFKRYKAPIHSSWIELGHGLKGGQCLKMEMNRSYRIWQILREIADMNSQSRVSPWNIRLKHAESGLFVHYLWQYSLFQIVQLVENKQMNADILSNEFAFHHGEHFVCFYSPDDDGCSYKSTYLPCNDNEENIASMIQKHEQYLAKALQMAMEQKYEESGDGDTSVDEKDEVADAVEVDDRNKHQLIATRVWEKRQLTMQFGDRRQCILLEDCSAGCECWTDDVAGCRIGYIAEHIFKIPLQEQGWIVNNRIVDYFDEGVGQLIFESGANLTLYCKQT